MDYMKVLKRAWNILWNYRVLWAFGFILALVSGEGGSSGFRTSFQSPTGGAFPPGGRGPAPQIPSEVLGVVVTVIAALLCLGLVLAIVFAILRYVVETALIRLVDDHEKTGEKHGFRQGFRLGWSRSALRLFLIDLLINVPVAVVFLLLFLLAAIPLLAWLVDNDAIRVIGTGITACLFFLLMLLSIIVSAVLSILRGLFWRTCILEGLGVVDSIRQGYIFVRQHLKDVLIMWLITVGLALIWSLLMIPVALLLIVLGGIIAAIPALLVGGLVNLVIGDQGGTPWILAAAVGLPIFILVLVIPLSFLDGLMKLYQSTTWTLTYRELQALASPAPSLS